MWSLVTSKGQRIPLRKLPAVLGSDKDEADVVLPHPSIEACHVRVDELENGDRLGVTAIDDAFLEVDGRKVGRGLLGPGDELTLGSVTLRATSDRASTAPAPSAGAAATPPAGGTDDDELTLRKPEPAKTAPPRSGGAPRAKGAAPKQGATRRRPDADRRGEVLSYSQTPARRGMLNADLSQLSGPVRALLIGVLLVVGAGVVWGLSTLVAGAM